MRYGKWSPDGERNRSREQHQAGNRHPREAGMWDDPQQEAKDARRSARERAQLWKTIKAEH